MFQNLQILNSSTDEQPSHATLCPKPAHSRHCHLSSCSSNALFSSSRVSYSLISVSSLRWLVILVPLTLWNRLNVLVDAVQDIRHVLLHCTNQAGPRMRHLTEGSRRELDYRAYLTRPDLVPKAVRFMLETGLLGQFQTLPTTYRVTTTDLRQPAA